MALYRELPHEAWKVGERFYRGRDVPETDAATQPEQVDLRAEDMRKAVEYGEQAKKLYEKLRAIAESADLGKIIADVRAKPR